MIKSFQHKGLRRFYETGSKAGINPNHAARLEDQLEALNTAETLDDMALPGYDLHPLTGNLAGKWAITVKENWRLTFEFADGDVEVLDYKDYH